MRIKDITDNQAIEMLNDICDKCDIKPNENQLLIAQTMKNVNGMVTIDRFHTAFNLLISGQLNVKIPYRMNNVFISTILAQYRDYRKIEYKEFTPEYEPQKSIEEINALFEEGLKASKTQLTKFLNGENCFFDPFFLYNEYDWLVRNKKLDPATFDELDIDEMSEKFRKYDKLTDKNAMTGKKYTPSMNKLEYTKAAVVALWLKD